MVFVGTSPCPHCGHELHWSKAAASGGGATSALHDYLVDQALNKPVKEIKPVPKTFLWCLAIVPWAASFLAGMLAGITGNPEEAKLFGGTAFVVSALVFFILDQREIKKSGRNGDGALWFIIVFVVGCVAIPIYLFISGKDTKRGKAPGFAYLGLAVLCGLLNLLVLGGALLQSKDAMVAESARQIVAEQLLPQMNVDGTCPDVRNMTKIGENKWSATAKVLVDGESEDLPIIITLRSDNFVLVEPDLVKLRARW